MLEAESNRIAQELTNLQDLYINNLLDKHLLKGKTPKELEAAGYKLVHEVINQASPMERKHVVSLCKVIDTTRWATKVDFNVG